MESRARDLKQTVIDGGYCIGCGACAAIPSSPFRMVLNAQGRIEATLDHKHADDPFPTRICPFAADAPNETEIGEQLFGAGARHDDSVGFYRGLYFGHVREGEFRAGGSSGGIGSWIAVELLRRDLVDAVVHVRATRSGSDKSPMLFEYAISESVQDVQMGSKSRYYPITLTGVLQEIRESERRYAVLALPCFAKALRLSARVDHQLAGRLCYVIALVCGHLKSARFADWIGWQYGIKPGNLGGIDFRHKFSTGPAMDYGYRVRPGSGQHIEPPRRSRSFFGTPWGYGLFKYPACEFCDDVFGETADLTIGDAWIEPFSADPHGTNLVVTRNAVLDELVRQASAECRLQVEAAPVERIIATQAGGLRDRRLGLSYRLHLKDQARQWRPPKRVAARDFASEPHFGRLVAYRTRLMTLSHRFFSTAVKLNSPRYFKLRLGLHIFVYEMVRRPLSGRIKGLIYAAILRLPRPIQNALRQIRKS